MASETLSLIIEAKDLATAAINNLRSGMERLTGASREYKSTVERLSGPANEFRNTIVRLGAAIGTVGLAKSFIDINASAEKTKLMLTGLMGSADKASEAFKWLLEISTQAPFSIGAMKDAFVKLQVAGLDPMRGSLETLMDAISQFGGSDQDLQLAAVAIQQMAGKGVVSLEELRLQLSERIPTAMEAMAEGLGMSMQQMTKEIEKGNISAEAGINAMMSKLKEWYGGTGVQMMNSWTGLISNLKVAWEKFMLTLGESGVFDKLKNVIDGVLKKIEEMKTSGDLKVWADRIVSVVNTVVSVITTLAGVIGKLLDIFGPFLPAIAQAIIYLKTFQIAVLGPIGIIGNLKAKIFALTGEFKALIGSGIIQHLGSLASSLIATANAAGILGMALKATVIGAVIFAVVEIGKLIARIIDYKKESVELSKAQEWIAENQQYINERAEKYNTILQELGFKTMAEFNRAVKEGTVIFNEQTKSWERLNTAAENQKKTYEDLIASLREGSAEWIAIKEKELKTLKTQIDYETALLEQQYKEGKLTLQQYLDEKKRLQENYLNEVIKLKEMEIELLKKAPEENLDKIKAIEEEIKQIRMSSAQEQIKIQTELVSEITRTREDEFNKWKNLQELKLQALKAHLDLENTIDEAAAQQGLIRQSELLERKLQRMKEYYEQEITIAEETAQRIADFTGLSLEKDIEEYEKVLAEKERLQLEYEQNIITSEQQIREARIKEESEANSFILSLTNDRIGMVEFEKNEKLKKLEEYWQQGLIGEQQYHDAIIAIEADAAEKTAEILNQTKIASSEALNEIIDVISDRRERLLDSMSSLLVEGWEDVKRYFGDWRAAVSLTVEDVSNQIRSFMNATTMQGYETFWHASLYGRKLIDMVGTSIYEWSQRVADYVNYIKNLLSSLRDTIRSYQDQLDELRGNKLTILDRWYKAELEKLKEKYGKELETSSEYQQALTLLHELYAEKRKKILEEEARVEDDFFLKKKKNLDDLSIEYGSGSVSGGSSIKLEKDVKLDINLTVPSLDKESTRRWAKEVLFPEWENYLRLKGVEL